jgi:hypothetical protein
MSDFEDDFPRAFCHMDDVDEKIMAFEQKYCTPLNEDDLRNVYAEVHADHEDCECSGCMAT